MGTKKRAVRGAGGRFAKAKSSDGEPGAEVGVNTAEPTGATAGEEPASVGSVAGGIPVEVDRPALLAEAAAIAAEMPAEAPAAPPADTPMNPAASPAAAPVDPAARAADVRPVVCLAVAQVAAMVAPNWEITKAESDAVGESLALVLAYWMPETGVDPKYLALGSLALSVWSVASARRDANGEWRPLRAPPKKPEPAQPSAPNGAALRL